VRLALWETPPESENWVAFRGPDLYLPRIEVAIFERMADARPDYRRRAQRVVVTDGGVVSAWEWYTMEDPPSWEPRSTLPCWDQAAGLRSYEAVWSIFQHIGLGLLVFPRAQMVESSECVS
jgi:hypothetical protein